jgi:hypothetical protein
VSTEVFGAVKVTVIDSPSVTAGDDGVNAMASMVTPAAVVHGLVITTLKSTVPVTVKSVVPPLFPLVIVSTAAAVIG